jgi:hypothetical protein
MGNASGVTFMHRNLGSTVPIANFERPVQQIFNAPGDTSYRVRLVLRHEGKLQPVEGSEQRATADRFLRL